MSGLPYKSKKLKGIIHLQKALRHNLREIAAELGPYGTIDIARTPSNYALRGHGSAAETLDVARHLVSETGLAPSRIRKDAIWGIEMVFTARPASGEDLRTFYEECTRWAESHFGVQVLSSVVHLDEGAPHCHVILLPLVDGRMNGARLYGGIKDLSTRMTEFHQAVGARFGLTRPAQYPRLSTSMRETCMLKLREFLAARSKMSASQIEAVLKPHFLNPLALLESFGLLPNGRASKGSFVEMMTRPVSPA